MILGTCCPSPRKAINGSDQGSTSIDEVTVVNSPDIKPKEPVLNMPEISSNSHALQLPTKLETTGHVALDSKDAFQKLPQNLDTGSQKSLESKTPALITGKQAINVREPSNRDALKDDTQSQHSSSQRKDLTFSPVKKPANPRSSMDKGHAYDRTSQSSSRQAHRRSLVTDTGNPRTATPNVNRKMGAKSEPIVDRRGRKGIIQEIPVVAGSTGTSTAKLKQVEGAKVIAPENEAGLGEEILGSIHGVVPLENQPEVDSSPKLMLNNTTLDVLDTSNEASNIPILCVSSPTECTSPSNLFEQKSDTDPAEYTSFVTASSKSSLEAKTVEHTELLTKQNFTNVSSTPRVVLIGKPSCGKTQVAKVLSALWNCPLINASELILENIQRCSAVGQKMRETLISGSDLRDQDVFELIKQEIESENCRIHGFILEDFPNHSEKFMTVAEQFNFLLQIEPKLNCILQLQISDEGLNKRWLRMRIDPIDCSMYFINTRKLCECNASDPCCTKGGMHFCKVDAGVRQRLITRYEDLNFNIDEHIRFYREEVEPKIQDFFSRVDSHSLFVLDCDKHRDEMLHNFIEEIKDKEKHPWIFHLGEQLEEALGNINWETLSRRQLSQLELSLLALKKFRLKNTRNKEQRQ